MIDSKQVSRNSRSKTSGFQIRQNTQGMIFADALAQHVDCHAAAKHPLFDWLACQAQAGSLTSEQFSILRKVFLGRIFPTKQNIMCLGTWALQEGKYEIFETALLNMAEEGGLHVDAGRIVTQPGGTHLQLAERAFNRVAGDCFGLPALSAKDAYEDCRFPAEFTQRSVFKMAYRMHPLIASFVQERASGGDGVSRLGMMGDLFRVFSPYQTRIAPNDFARDVTPYFAGHISLVKNNAGILEAECRSTSVECQHGERAKLDVANSVDISADTEKYFALASSILDAQAALFQSLLDHMKGLAPQESKIPTYPSGVASG